MQYAECSYAATCPGLNSHKLETIHELGGKFQLQMSFGFTVHYIAQWEIVLVVHMNIYWTDEDVKCVKIVI